MNRLISKLKPEKVSDDFFIHRNQINAGHIIYFMKYVIGFEAVFLVIAALSYSNGIVPNFDYTRYMLMYSLLIIVSLLMHRYAKKALVNTTMHRQLRFYTFTILYIIFFIGWGLTVSLFDQVLYANLNAYYINIVAVMALIYLPYEITAIIYTLSMLILFILLPVYQINLDIIRGHIINTLVFNTFMVVSGFIHYRTFKRQYDSQKHLKEQILENEMIQRQLESAVERLEGIAIQDQLTKLPNRRGLHDFINRIKSVHLPDDTTVGVLMIDIDHFKDYNDAYGHGNGDEALCHIADLLDAGIVSLNEYVVRYGGEEFLQVCIGKSKQEIMSIADDICHRIRSAKIPHGYSRCADVITVSVGITYSQISQIQSLSQIINEADQALYEAKKNGKNQAILYKKNA